MAKQKEPQVLPPERDVSGMSDEGLETVATLLDDLFRIPGTSIRFGLDPLIGLIPGFGDAVSGFASFLIVYSAWQRQLPRVTIARMVANVALDSLIGAVPFLGDMFDAAWKSNRRNIELLKRAQYTRRREQVWHDWLFLLLVVLAIVALVMVPILLLWFVINLIRG